MDKATGLAVEDSEGNAIVVTTTFTPKSNSGTTEVEITFDSSDLAGHDVVVFEKLIKDGVEVASHEDITDTDQTIHIVGISTTAKDSLTGTDYVSGDSATIVDTVSYSGLVTGETYTVSGTLMDKATGEVALDSNEEPIVTSTTFVANASSGSIDVTFDITPSDFVGSDLVVFEKLIYSNTEIASHEDIDDEGQTIHVVQIKTTLTSQNGTHYADPKETIELVDTVAYSGLVLGETYSITGILMDKESGEALVDSAGCQIISIAEFCAQASDGVAEVTFTFDASDLTGTAIVAFEELSIDGTVIADHKDIDDEDQTVRIVQISTELTDAEGNHNVSASDSLSLVDSVSYSGLIPGETYQMVGTLMNKATGEALEFEDGKPICAETAFVPDATDGEVEVVFEFDATNLPDGFELVAFEECLDVDGDLVCAHEDIDSDSQTVSLVNTGVEQTQDAPTASISKGKSYAKTGFDLGAIELALIALVITGCVTAGYAIYKVRIRKNGTELEV
jgi:hypothetical protein